MTRLTRDTYEKLVADDIQWLTTKCQRTLESEHIVDILKTSATHEYECAEREVEAGNRAMEQCIETMRGLYSALKAGLARLDAERPMPSHAGPCNSESNCDHLCVMAAQHLTGTWVLRQSLKAAARRFPGVVT